MSEQQVPDITRDAEEQAPPGTMASPQNLRRRPPVRRAAWWAAVVVVLLVGAAAILIAWRLWIPLPRTSGRMRVAGLTAPVEIVRDVDGVPHIRAATERDGHFALGFVHAQDRLWQMEFQRRVGHGRLAEILGPAALPGDRLFRTLGLTGHAAALWATTDAEWRAPVEAYVRGVNSYLERHRGRRLPVEFGLLGVVPEPWRPEDVIVWLKVMAWELSFNWRDELLRTRLVARVGQDGAEALMPAYTDGLPAIVPEAGVEAGTVAPDRPAARARRLHHGLEATARALGSLKELESGIAASNNWVVSGARTATGKPLLANDPHLGAQAPALWYLAHVEGGGFRAIGASLPGAPGIIIGHNGRVAWGVTAVMTDNQDLFIEQVNARNEALYRGRWEPMGLRRETIRVKGAPDETLVVRSTRHGPLVSDLAPGASQALALSWSALTVPDGLLGVWSGVNRARSWWDFVAALSQFRAPMQNFVYADVEGNIGYCAPGAIPLRPFEGDGTLPVPGWTGEHDWLGEVPADRLPQIYNPSRGYVVSANNPVAEGLPYVVSTNWEPGYRAARIVELVEQAPALTSDAVARMQADVRSAQVRVVLPWLRRARPQNEASRRALERLRLWDGTLSAESAEAAIYETWIARIVHRLLIDDLGDELWRDYTRPPYWAPKALHRVVARSDDSWCDDVRTDARESCEETLGLALAEAVGELAGRQGGEQAAWRWGRENEVVFPHLPLHLARWLRPFFSRRVGAGGDALTVNPVMRSGDRLIISSYRQVVDLADLDASRFVTTLGQSGHVLSRNYDDMLERWRAGGYVPMRFSRAAVDAAARGRLELTP